MKSEEEIQKEIDKLKGYCMENYKYGRGVTLLNERIEALQWVLNKTR